MPIVDISLLAGRDAESKQTLMRTVTDAVEASLGVPRASIRVILREVSPEHWSVAGVPKATPASDKPTGADS